MFFSKSNEGTKVLEAACKAGGIQLDKGRIIGSPERLNLFTIEGDLLRVDLDLEAHLGSTLQPSSVLILEKVRADSHHLPVDPPARRPGGQHAAAQHHPPSVSMRESPHGRRLRAGESGARLQARRDQGIRDQDQRQLHHHVTDALAGGFEWYGRR